MNAHPSQPGKSIHLQLGSENFFDIFINEHTFQTVISEGKLSDGRKVANSVHEQVRGHHSFGLAEDYALEIVNDKLDEGFELVSEKGWEEKSQSQEIQEDDSPLVPKNIRTFFEQFVDKDDQPIEKSSENSSVEEEFSAARIEEIRKEEVKEEKGIKEDDGRQIQHKVNKEKVEEEEEKKGNDEESHGPFIQKELKLSGYMKAHSQTIQEKAESLNLIYESIEDKMLIAGPQEYIVEFLAWLYTHAIEKMERQIDILKQANIEKKNNEYEQIEVTFSTFQRMHQDEIFAKANRLELICDFAYDMLLVSGYIENLKEFKAFLQEVEVSAKKSLYPKYWDFHRIEKFTEILVTEDTEEFQEVEALFCKTLNNMRITKLLRIQNKYLMDNFVTMLQKRQELRDEIDTSRKLLFHGSRQIRPESIYKDSDVGFDLQYSNPGGSYGKGLYFAQNSNYSHGYTYNVGNGSYQMFLADVFVGRSTRVPQGGGLLKAPKGFDSVEAAESFYIVYNNFHSYPLYLIEYAVNNGPAYPNNAGNINVLNNNFVKDAGRPLGIGRVKRIGGK